MESANQSSSGTKGNPGRTGPDYHGAFFSLWHQPADQESGHSFRPELHARFLYCLFYL